MTLQEQTDDLVEEAQGEWKVPPCRCGPAPCDYCHTCREFYFIHARTCHLYVSKHHGHRCTLVPSIEKPLSAASFIDN